MSARAHHRRAARAAARSSRRHGETRWGTQAGWCGTESDLEECRKVTHDSLIKLMGDRRTGGVRWAQSTGPSAFEQLEVMAEGTTGEEAEYYAQIRRHLTEYGGWLVVAMAPGDLVADTTDDRS